MLLYVIKRPYTKYSVYTERFTGTYKLYFLVKKRLHEKWSFPYKISSFFVQWKLKAISSFIVMMIVVMLNCFVDWLTVKSLLALFKMRTITWGFYHWMPWWTRSRIWIWAEPRFRPFWMEYTLILPAWKVPEYGVFSGPYFSVFELNTEIYGGNLRISPIAGKYGLQKTPYFDTFDAVIMCHTKLSK